MVNPYTVARGGLDAMEGLGCSREQGGGVETAPAADRAVTGLSFMEGVGRKPNDALEESLRDVTRGPAETPGPRGQTGPLPCEGGLAPQNNGFERQLTALQAQYLEAITALDLKQKELEAQKTTLDHTCREVIKTNNALSVLARNIDRRREELAEKVARAVSTKILPVVNEMRRYKLPARIQCRLDVLTALLADLTPEGAKARDVISVLSPTELRLAMMIKKGFSSVAIGRRAAFIGADDAGAARPQRGPLSSRAHRGVRPRRAWGTVRPEADQERFPADWNDPLELYGRWRRQLALPVFDPSIERVQARALAGRYGAQWVWRHRHQLVALRKFMARTAAMREVPLPPRMRAGGMGDGPHP